MTTPAGFADSALTEDALLGGLVRLLQPRAGYRAATDPVLLAAASAAKPGARVLDAGCGAGAAMLCLAARVPGLETHGLELQPPYAGLARRNADLNGVAAAIWDGDLFGPPAELRRIGFDIVMTNPPYFDAFGAPSPDPGRDAARRATGDEAPRNGPRPRSPGSAPAGASRRFTLRRNFRRSSPGSRGPATSRSCPCSRARAGTRSA